MKSMNPRAISFLAAVIMITAALLTSCGGGSADNNAPVTGAAETQTQAEVTEITRVSANLPERDYDGETITFFGRIYDGVWSAIDIIAEEADGELVNDAILERTNYIEETYNVNLAVIKSDDTQVASKLKTFITAGDDSFDAIVCNVYDSGAIAVGGMLYDLNAVEHIDLEQPWWSKMMNNSLSIGFRNYYAAGDIFIVDNKGTRVFFFNKNMVEEFGLESPYDLIFDGVWTIDKYMAHNEAVGGDINGDNQITREHDRFGTMAQTTLGSVLYFASGELLTAKDENNIPYIACASERALAVMTGISEKIAGSAAISCSGETKITAAHPDNLYYFQEGRVLFAPEVLAHIETMRGCEVDIGIIPPPKYDENQESYHCYADGWCVNVVSIPVTNNEAEKVAFVIEAMAADSANNLTPAYYEVALTDKFVRDEESVKMLDLILDSVSMDNANIFSWAGIESIVGTAIYKGEAIASKVESKLSSLQAAIDKTVAAFLDI